MVDRTAREAVARGFFRSPNKIVWEDYERGRLPANVTEQIAPWVDRLLRGAAPVLLPLKEQHATTWYAAAETPRGFRHLQEELKALLGATYSDFEGQPTHLDPSIPCERALADCYGRQVIRLRIKPEDRDIVRRRLARFASLRDEAPERGDTIPRPTGRILADFDEALRQGNSTEAARCIDELERNGQLDAQNLLYLRIRTYEARGLWQDVVDAARRYGLLHATRRPRRIGQAILRAIYTTEFAPYQASDDAAGAMEHFAARVNAWVQPLLVSRRVYDCAEADALFVMSAIARDRSRANATAVLEDVPADAAHRPWLQNLIDTLPKRDPEPDPEPSPIVDPLLDARIALSEGDLDRAWTLSRSLEPSEASANVVLRCAWDLDSLEAAELALQTFEALSSEAQERLQRVNSIATALEHLRALVVPAKTGVDSPSATSHSHIPQGWQSWAQAVQTDQKWLDAAEVARHGIDEWDPEEFASPECARTLADVLSTLDGDGWARISESMPYLLSGLGQCRSLPRQMGSALEHLTKIHILDDKPGRLYFSTLANLCDLTLQVGVDDESYSELLRDSLGAVEENAGAADFDGLLEFLDTLVTHAAPDPALRGAIAGAIAGLFIRFKRKADDVQLSLLPQLLAEAGCEVPESLRPAASEAGHPAPLAALAGKNIALYSLKENALHRVAALLNATVPNVRVTTFHDKAGGSKALRAAARNADVFVMATAAASHAATGFIEAQRSEGAPVLKPAGQGSASMLRSLHQWCASD